MKRHLLFIVIVAFSLPASAFYSGWEDGPWEREDVDDGLVVYLNEQADEDVPAVRVDTVIDASPAEVFAIMIRHDRARNQEDVVAYDILKQSKDGFVTYQRVDPTGIDPRDFILEGSYIRPKGEGGSYAFRWKASSAGPKATDAAVRVRTAEGVFALEPAAGGKKTRASYRSLFDPEVSAPSFFVTRALVSDATDRVRALRRDASSAR